MPDPSQMAEDLEFVRHAVQRRRVGSPSPVGLAVLWAGITLGGCIWSDVSYNTCGIYWLTAPVLGYIVSSFLGMKQVLRLGQLDHQEGIRQGLHWSVIFIAIIPIMAMGMSGRIGWGVYGQLAFLISGIVNYLAGVHFDRRWMLPGLAMMASSLLVMYVPRYPWTACGVVIAASLLISFCLPARRSGDASHAE